MSGSHQQHRDEALKLGPVAVAVVTVSDTRTPEDDRSGQFLQTEIARSGNRLSRYTLVPDDPEQIAGLLEELVCEDHQVVIFSGGTGISKRDNTFDVISRRLEKTLPGFGELFRALSFQQIGPAAMLSRATAGTYRGVVVLSLPGSPAAVRLAWQELIEPEIRHLAREVSR